MFIDEDFAVAWSEYQLDKRANEEEFIDAWGISLPENVYEQAADIVPDDYLNGDVPLSGWGALYSDGAGGVDWEAYVSDLEDFVDQYTDQ